VKVLIHTPSLDTPGGKSNYISILSKHLSGDVTLFVYGSKGSNEFFLTTFFRLIGDFIRFNRVIREGSYDLVHLNPSLNPKSYFRDSVFAWITKYQRKKLLVFWHGWRWSFDKRIVQKSLPFFHWTFGRADAMIVLANDFEIRLRTYGFERPIFKETTVVEEANFNIEIPNDYSLKKNILFISRIQREKGIYETVDAFRMIQDRFPDIHLKFAGVGGDLEDLKDYVSRQEITRVEFLGWISGAEKLKCYRETHTFVLASYYGEGMPCAILEAMASGLPVLTTRVGGVSDFFEDGKMGFLVEQRDAQSLSEKMQEILSDKDLAQKIGVYNRDYARMRFAPGKVASRIQVIYQKVCQE